MVFSVFITLVTIVLCIFIFIFLGRFLAKPFERLINDVSKIDAGNAAYTKIEEVGSDEFFGLRSTINSLLGRIGTEQQEVSAQKEIFRTTLLSVGDGVLSVDEKHVIQFMNPAAEAITGWKQSEAVGMPVSEVFVIINEYSRESTTNPIIQAMSMDEVVQLENHTLLIAKDGTEVPVEDTAAPIKNSEGRVTGSVLVFRNCSERKEKQKQIEYISYHDQLTGLYNRRFFDEEMTRTDVPENLPLTFVYADVNGLKTINDAFGHHIGDQLIQNAANLFSSVCRPGDKVIRTGGDEFIIILPKTGEEYTKKLMKRITDEIETAKLTDINISISFGWDTKIQSGQNAWDILKNAEDIMYQKKFINASGKSNVEVPAVLRALYVKSPGEDEHSHKVGSLCLALAAEYGLSDSEAQELKSIGELHDIGKIAIDECLLNKTTPLTEAERANIRRHPDIGFRLLNASIDFHGISEIVLCHHECWDGSGYPRGLRGDMIPWKARVLAVADAFEMMLRDQPYGKALSVKEAVAEILNNAGTQFDPEIARLFIDKVMRNFVS